MASKRPDYRRSEEFRLAVKVGVLRDRLEKHALGELEMTDSQIKSAMFLINKCVSNPLQQQHIEHDGAVTLTWAK